MTTANQGATVIHMPCRKCQRLEDDLSRIYQRLLTLEASVQRGANGHLDSWTDEQLVELGDLAATVACTYVGRAS